MNNKKKKTKWNFKKYNLTENDFNEVVELFKIFLDFKQQLLQKQKGALNE